MASICNPTGSLSVVIQESIELPNGNLEQAFNRVIIPGVCQLVRRVDQQHLKKQE